MRVLAVASLAVLTLLAACGTNEGDRTTGGAATGAGTGAVIGLLGGPIGVGVGALIGGAVGATTGAAVAPQDLTLPPPPWSGQR
jgi:surface antigen